MCGYLDFTIQRARNTKSVYEHLLVKNTKSVTTMDTCWYSQGAGPIPIILAEADDEFCGREGGEAPASFPATENVVSSDDEESEGDRHHFLDDELDVAGAAAQFNALVIDDTDE